MKMKAAVVRQATDPYKFEEVELAEPKNDEVLVTHHCQRSLPH